LYPLLFYFYGFEIHTYPVIIFLALIISSYYFALTCFKRKLTLDFLSDHFLYIILGTFIFARVGGILESLSLYNQNPLRIIYIFDGAYNFYIAFFGFLITFFIITILKKESFWKWMDAIALPFLLFVFFLAIAEFLSGGNYGTPSGLPWAISFNIPEVRYTIPIHPVQMYEAIFLLLLFFIIRFMQNKSHHNGVISLYTAFGFFTIKVILSFFRGAPDLSIFNFRFSLVVSLILAIICFILIIIKTHNRVHYFNDKN